MFNMRRAVSTVEVRCLPYRHDPHVYELLDRHRAAYVVTSGPGMACNLCATTDFGYVRMHGPDTSALYAGS